MNDLERKVEKKLRKHGYAEEIVNPTEYHHIKAMLEDAFGCPVISKSSLCDYMDDPYKYYYDREKGIRKQSKSLRAGSIIDTLALTPDIADRIIAVEEINRRTNAGKARAAELEAAGKIIVSPEEYAEASENAKLVRDTIKRELGDVPWHSQHAVWVKMDTIGDVKLPTPIILTGMMDILPESDTCPIIDLKTTSAKILSTRELEDTVARYNYGVQAAIYTDLLYTIEQRPRPPFTFLFINTSPPTRLRFFEMRETDITACRALYTRKIQDFAEAWKNDDYGEALVPRHIGYLPKWYTDEIGRVVDAPKPGEYAPGASEDYTLSCE